MPLAISADFPLGFYQGRDASGSPEKYPDFARVFSSLLGGAYSLERNEGRDTSKGLLDIDAQVFNWFESAAPDAVRLPVSILSKTGAITFRNHGLIDSGTDRSRQSDPASIASFLDGPCVWYWQDTPSEAVFERMMAILTEVPYLGEAVSPVLLRAGEIDVIPDDVLYRTNPSFDAKPMYVPSPGRVAELDTYHASLRPKKIKDKLKGKEDEVTTAPPRVCIGTAYYKEKAAPAPTGCAPWRTGLLLRLEDGVRIPHEQRCMWTTCLHRALVRVLGDALPKSMKKVQKDMLPLANCLAIQVVSPDMPVRSEYASLTSDMLVVMIPTDAPQDDETNIAAALEQIPTLYLGKLGSVRLSFDGEVADLSRFWQPVQDGFKRWFETVPVFLPEGRPPSRKKESGSQWMLSDDVRIAIGHVWRNRFAVKETGDKGRIELSRAVEASGIAVTNCRLVPSSSPANYAHKINPGSPLVCSRAFIDLSPLDCDEALVAIGQSRHFGGGLLVPVDVPSVSDSTQK